MVVEVALLQKRQDMDAPTGAVIESTMRQVLFGTASIDINHPGWKPPRGVMVVVQRQTDLPEVVRAERPPGRLNRRQQHRNQNADDGDHHQQFHQGKNRNLNSAILFSAAASRKCLAAFRPVPSKPDSPARGYSDSQPDS